MMEQYFLRFAFSALAAGAFGVLGARLIAHYMDQDPWLVRVVAYFLLALGIVGVGACLSLAVALKLLGAAALLCPAMAWVDAMTERQEEKVATERMEKLIGPPGGTGPEGR
jgi:hypothetical protein